MCSGFQFWKPTQNYKYSIKLTTPTDVKAATMLMSVGIMLNFPAYEWIQFVSADLMFLGIITTV